MKKVVRWIAAIIGVSVVIVAANLLIEGIPLFGTPDAEKIEMVAVEHKDYPDTIREYTDEENIELAVALLGYLRYSPLKDLSDDNQLIQITYIMGDGTECVVSANNLTVWWKGTPRALTDEDTFVKMCTAVFFPEVGNMVDKDKLIYGATHDPNADNSEYAISGEGEPLEPTE